ncbi:hypothetical protein BSKO_05122 [Bryopsis sp. KO-2023]|nr:hypothetical protein BSKO_05122 [Bryopsis sp. KO-2023]
MDTRVQGGVAGEVDAGCREEEKAERRVPPTCAVCDEIPSKYRCPACEIRTCSLGCSRKHKDSTGCTGKRSRTEFKSIKEFDDRQLMSDYGFLEELVRFKDANKRTRPDYLNKSHSCILSKFQGKLHQAALERNIRLQFLSSGMERRRMNNTTYNGKEIRWRVEWSFEKAGVVVFDQRVLEDRKLEEVLRKHLTVDAGRNALLFKLKDYVDAGIQGLKVVMKKEGTPADKPTFHELSLDLSLKEALNGKKVVEFPRFLVLTPKEMQSLTLESV